MADENVSTANSPLDPQERDLDLMVSNILRGGLLAACAVMIVGAAMHLCHPASIELNLHQFASEPLALRSISGILGLAATGDQKGVMQLAILILLATPFLRVIFAGWAFAKQKDYKFAVICAIVLLVLLFGLYCGHVSEGG